MMRSNVGEDGEKYMIGILKLLAKNQIKNGISNLILFLPRFKLLCKDAHN